MTYYYPYSMHAHTGHMNTITAVAHSPTAPALITCSLDNRVRFFHYQESANK